MSPPADCSQNIDPLKLVREGTSQDGRSSAALDPAYAPVDEHGVAHNMVFAQSYAVLLKYFDSAGVQSGDWSPFFSGDVSVLLAVPAIEDMDTYVSNTQSWFNYLNETENQANTSGLKDRFGFLYGSVASLAVRLDTLAQGLPADVPLKGALQNLIRTQLAPAFKRLVGYYKAAVALGLINDVAPPARILRRPGVSFHSVFNPASPAETLSEDWSEGLAWPTYTAGIAQDASVYGESLDPFSQINHCSTHTLFKSVFDQFLKVFARVVGEAQTALDDTLTKRNNHQPHHALFFAFLRLLERARASGNTLTQRHLDFYYRVILGLKEKNARPGHVFLLAELAKQASSRAFKPGELFKAGKDDRGKDALFANRNDFVANQAKVAALQTLYRHGGESVGSSSLHTGRLFASPVANSDDGLGAPLTSADGSWHPFFNKIYVDGALAEIRMPKAEIGFAIASHYLLMAEGTRWIVAVMTVSGYTGAVLDASWSNVDQVGFGRDDVSCLLTVEKGWLEQRALFFVPASADTFYLVLEIGGGDPAIVPYSAKAHGYSFQTDAPMLLVKLKQDDTRRYAYPAFQNVSVTDIALSVYVGGVKSLAASNDFGPLDTSKPFQPFGFSPVSGSSLIIGSKEIFQKKLSYAWITLNWLTPPWAFAPTPLPTIGFDFLSAGDWKATGNAAASVAGVTYVLTSDLDKPVLEAPDYTPNAPYSTQSRYGFARLKLSGGFGQDTYQAALIHYMRKDPANAPDPGGKPPTGPTASSLSMGYAAESALVLNTSDKNSYANRPGQFFHLTPFGTAEQHPYLNGKGRVCLFPQFEFGETAGVLESEAEFYIGIAGLAPPQNLSLLFQVADGTANPLALKPAPHIDWSYLKGNEWIEFQANEVQNTTDDLLNSGIVTFTVPRNAANDNTLLQSGLFWIRAAVHQNSDAICRLQLATAQAMEAEFVDRGNSPDYSATPLPAGTISKLDKPDAAVKTITQPFPSFGGSSAERSNAFYTRVSERLRHKNRAIALWDYERLILERFPQIYKVRCLNHTCYEPSESGSGIYRELAPGHVTIVSVPNLQSQNLRDPLKPFTSLGLLEDIKAFLQERTSCFAQLHVKNPQFEEVRVRFSLRLRDGFDETYYANLLRQAITRFLSPWAFAGGGTPSFGGRIYKSVLINFVEEQPYVDYVTDFRVFHDVAGVRGTVDLDEVQGSRAVSILVSVPASKHEIAILKPEQDAPLGELCSCDA